MVFHWNLNDNKSPQVSRTLLSILANLSNAVVWKVSTRPLFSKSSFTNRLVIEPTTPITNGITVSFTFHSFINSLSGLINLSFLYFSISFTRWSAGTAKSTILQVLSFVDYYKVWSSGRDYVIRFYFKISEEFVHLFLLLFVWSNFSFLHSSQCITLPTQSCQVLYSFCANLLPLLVMWLIVSSLSPCILHLLFCCVSVSRTNSGLCIYHLFLWSDFSFLHSS